MSLDYQILLKSPPPLNLLAGSALVSVAGLTSGFAKNVIVGLVTSPFTHLPQEGWRQTQVSTS